MKSAAAVVAVLAIAVAACGKKGPPLPPLVRLPAAPGQFTAARQGNGVAIHFNVPTANTDGSTPADVSHVEVYALTGSATSTPDDIMKRGTRVGDLTVNAAPDPEESDDGKPKAEKPKLPGAVDQGASVRLADALSSDPPAADGTVRAYLAVGFNARGRRGAFSSRVLVPIGPPPPTPAQPTVTLRDEKTIVVTWPVPDAPGDATSAASPGSPSASAAPPPGPPAPTPALSAPTPTPAASAAPEPSAAPGAAASTTANSASVTSAAAPTPPAPSGPTYQVYLAGDGGQTLNSKPRPIGLFEDHEFRWGVERCYVVRTLDSQHGLALESDPSPVACVTPVDTFPPKMPSGLNVIAGAGAMNLIWDPNDEADLAGYIVLRAIAPDTELAPVTQSPLESATFRDAVPPGSRVTYAVRAVDKAGNASAASARVEEIAR